jgi:hypothetical protein
MSLSCTPASVNHLSSLPTPLLADDRAIDGRWFRLPNALGRYRHLGLSAAQLGLVVAIRGSWTDAGLPEPAIPQLAEDLMTSERQVYEMLADLKAKGYVIVHEHTGPRNERLPNSYSFAPLFAAAEQEMAAHKEAQRAAWQASHADSPPLSCGDSPPLSCQDRANEDVPKMIGNEVSVPPTPVATVSEPSRDEEPLTATDAREERPQRPQGRLDAAYQALVEPLTAIGEELGDRAHPLASATRAYKLMTAARLDVGSFLALMEEARLHTLSAIEARRRNKPPKPVANPMAYYFGVLARLTRPDTAPPPWRTGHARPEAATAPATPAPLPPPSGIWGAITAEAGQVMTSENIARWFTTARQLTHADDVLTVAVPDTFHQRWLDVRLRAKIEQCAARVRPGLQVTFVVQSAMTPLDPAQ